MARRRKNDPTAEETAPPEEVTPETELSEAPVEVPEPEAPKEEEAPAAESPPEPAPQQEPKPVSQVSQVARIPRRPRPKVESTMDVQVFTAVQRIRPDEAVGFLHYAQLHKLGSRSLTEWRKAWDAYRRRPVK